MAICSNHNTGTTTCSGHRPSCAANNPLPGSIPTVILGNSLAADQINGLKAYMNSELDRYRQHASFRTLPLITSAFTRNAPIDAASWASLGSVFFSVPSLPASGSPLDDAFWTALLTKYNQIRQDCICNADCSCNAVCACYGDCCDYSDERLKQEITYC